MAENTADCVRAYACVRRVQPTLRWANKGPSAREYDVVPMNVSSTVYRVCLIENSHCEIVLTIPQGTQRELGGYRHGRRPYATEENAGARPPLSLQGVRTNDTTRCVCVRLSSQIGANPALFPGPSSQAPPGQSLYVIKSHSKIKLAALSPHQHLQPPTFHSNGRRQRGQPCSPCYERWLRLCAQYSVLTSFH